MTVEIKNMTSVDIPRVVDIEKSLFTADPWTADLFADELAQVGISRDVVCVWNDGQIVGYASLRFVGREGDVNTVAVAKSHQGQGIGRQLMDWLYETANTRGVRELFLEVRSDNDAALAMYTKDDFQRIDIRRNYYGTDIDAIVMKKRLAS